MMAMVMTDGDLCGLAGLASEREWMAHLASAPATRRRLAGGKASLRPRVFSAASHCLRRCGPARTWRAVGDAALAVDPVSGNGVVRALRSAQLGAERAVALLKFAVAS